MKGFKAVLIRKGDYYIGHRKRTALARESRADLFVSIHADAFKESTVSGASVYTLSDRGATSETAKWLAERANQSDMLGGVGNVNLSDKDDVLAHVLLDMSMDGYRVHSIGVGEAVLRNMAKVTKLHKKKGRAGRVFGAQIPRYVVYSRRNRLYIKPIGSQKAGSDQAPNKVS